MKTDRERLIELCSDLLEGRNGLIEASRVLSRLRFSIGPEDDPDFTTFLGIDSETDHLPVGSDRVHWQSEALKRKDKEIQEAEAFFHARAIEAATNLIEKHKIEPVDASKGLSAPG